MTERSALESIKSVIMDVPQMLKTISARLSNLWAECRESPDRDGPETSEDTPAASQEGVVNVELNPFKPSPEQEEQMPLTKDQRVVLSLLQCGYSKYLYLPKERAISTHGWLG